MTHAQKADLKRWQWFLHRMVNVMRHMDPGFVGARDDPKMPVRDISHGYCLDNHGVSDVF